MARPYSYPLASLYLTMGQDPSLRLPLLIYHNLSCHFNEQFKYRVKSDFQPIAPRFPFYRVLPKYERDLLQLITSATSLRVITGHRLQKWKRILLGVYWKRHIWPTWMCVFFCDYWTNTCDFEPLPQVAEISGHITHSRAGDSKSVEKSCNVSKRLQNSWRS